VDETPEALPVIFLFVLLTSLMLMNMLIGVLVEVVQAVAETEKEALTIEHVRGELVDIMQMHDLPVRSGINKGQFCELLCSQRTVQLLSKMEVDAESLVDLADFIFAELEPPLQDDMSLGPTESADKVLTFRHLMQVFLTMRQSNGATVKHIVDLQKFMGKQMAYMEALLERQDTKINKRLARTYPSVSTNGFKLGSSSTHSFDSGASGKEVSKLVSRGPLSSPRGEGAGFTVGKSNENTKKPEAAVDEESSQTMSETNDMFEATSDVAMEKEQMVEERLRIFDETITKYCKNIAATSRNTSSVNGMKNNPRSGAASPREFGRLVDILQVGLKQLLSIHEHCIAGYAAASGESLSSKPSDDVCNKNVIYEHIDKSISLEFRRAGLELGAAEFPPESLSALSSPCRLRGLKL
jgi:hypothetical protein